MKPYYQIPEETRALLADQGNMPISIEVNGLTFYPKSVQAWGNKGVVWKGEDRNGRTRAMKVTPFDAYDDDSYLEEITLASKIESGDHFAELYEAGYCKISFKNKQELESVVFIERWIEGITFQSYIEQNSIGINPSFILAFMAGVCESLSILASYNLQHIDLHAKNIMIADPKVGVFNPEHTVVIVDNSSLRSSDYTFEGIHDEHQSLVNHLIRLHNVMHRRKLLTMADKRFLEEIQKLLANMIDPDKVIALRNPKDISDQIRLAYLRSFRSVSVKNDSLENPFEFISAEHIANDELLVKLFAESCPWLEKVKGPDPCLVTGPRGCGKSTIFRWLSLKAQLTKPGTDHLASMPIFGFYISCSTDLQNRLSWIKTKELALKHEKGVIHYFNLIAAREVVSTIIQIAARNDSEPFWGLGQHQQLEISDFIQGFLARFNRYDMRGRPRLDQMRENIERELSATHADMLLGKEIKNAIPETFLADLTIELQRILPLFKTKTLAFLVDDFSTHRIPESVQVTLNRIIWERRSSHVFKLSSEKRGAFLSDSAGVIADTSRELIEIDCGMEFISLEDGKSVNSARLFAKELLDNRLRQANYKGSAQTLIGNSPKSSLAKDLISKEVGKSTSAYYGLERVADLCSGDVSHLLLVYRKIFEVGRIGKSSDSIVSAAVQHNAVVDISRQLLNNVQYYYPCGQQMHRIANSFGKLVRNVLERGAPMGKDKVLQQCPRIEIDQVGGSVAFTLDAQDASVSTELIRRAIFIDMDAGLSRHGNVTTLRWHFRRIYLPAFGASLAKTTAVKQNPDWFRLFLKEPDVACDRHLRSIKTSDLQTSIADVLGGAD